MATPSGSTPSTPSYTEAWLPGYDGLQFYTRTYAAASPARAVLLFVHGFAEHVARYEWAHGVYASRGITVFTYDQRGFGRTALDKERKSKESAWGKTNWHDQFSDIEWWLKRLRSEHPGLPLFLMGHSMGGGLALGFATRPSPPPAPESVKLLSGIIASSPLLLQTHPAPKILRYIGGKACLLFPNLLIDAPVPVEDLSHDPEAHKAAANDPLMMQKGSLKGLFDMLGGGEQLLWNDYKNWPQSLPLLIVHGTADRVSNRCCSFACFSRCTVLWSLAEACRHAYTSDAEGPSRLSSEGSTHPSFPAPCVICAIRLESWPVNVEYRCVEAAFA
ncbi:alpha/beta-hydrolase [Trametes sanguinea]|nr:alpha/beta-hydrolase [Trametes sanguinea]